MNCKKCGEILEKGTMFCPSCGTNLQENNNGRSAFTDIAPETQNNLDSTTPVAGNPTPASPYDFSKQNDQQQATANNVEEQSFAFDAPTNTDGDFQPQPAAQSFYTAQNYTSTPFTPATFQGSQSGINDQQVSQQPTEGAYGSVQGGYTAAVQTPQYGQQAPLPVNSKKSGKKTAIIIASAVVAVIAVLAGGFFLFERQMTDLFIGRDMFHKKLTFQGFSEFDSMASSNNSSYNSYDVTVGLKTGDELNSIAPQYGLDTDLINKTQFKFSGGFNDDKIGSECALVYDDKNELSTQMIISSDEIIFSLPELTARTLKIENNDETKQLFEMIESIIKSKGDGKFDSEKFDAFMEELNTAIYESIPEDCYSYGDYEIDGKTYNSVILTLDSEQFIDILDNVLDTLKNSDYVKDMFETANAGGANPFDALGGFDKYIENIQKGLQGFDQNLFKEFRFTNVYSGNGLLTANKIGMEIVFEPVGSSKTDYLNAKMFMVDGKFEASIEVSGQEIINLSSDYDKSGSAFSGTLDVSIQGTDLFAVDYDFDISEVTASGIPAGTYKINNVEIPDLAYMNPELVFKAENDDETDSYSLSLNTNDALFVGIDMEMTLSKDEYELPDISSKDAENIEDIANDTDFQNEIQENIAELTQGEGLIAQITELFNNMFTGSSSYDYDDYYDDYYNDYEYPAS